MAQFRHYYAVYLSDDYRLATLTRRRSSSAYLYRCRQKKCFLSFFAFIEEKYCLKAKVLRNDNFDHYNWYK